MFAAAAVLSRRCRFSGGGYDFFRRGIRSGFDFGEWRSCRSLASRSDEISKIPRLMVLSRVDPESLYLYNLAEDEYQTPKLDLQREVCVPPAIAKNRCLIGSSRGFLFFMARSGSSPDIQAVNPFTGSILHLPPETSPDSHPELIKPMLFPSFDTVLLLHCSISAKTKLEFSRLHHPSSSSWTPVPIPLATHRAGVEDCIFHKGRLHIVDFFGSVAIFDEHLFDYFDNPSLAPSEPSVCHLSCYLPKDHQSSHRKYLVESPDGEDLYLLFKYDRFCWFPPGIMSFKVFKLDKNDGCKWKKVENIGDYAMFVGEDFSMSLYAPDFNLKPNSIYFIDDDCRGHVRPPLNGLVDTGVYYLETKSIELIGVTGAQVSGYPLATWLEPPTC